MAWNLVDSLMWSSPATPPRRHFYVPLASTPAAQDIASTLDRTRYTFSESYTTLPLPDGRTSNICLNVQIQPPAGCIADDQDDPDPLICLHAVDTGRLYFLPAGGNLHNRLVLEMRTFAALNTPALQGLPRWFAQWQAAGAIPMSLVYENIDRDHLKQVLENSVAPAADNEHHGAASVPAIRLPDGITAATKAGFIARFLAGHPDHFLRVEAGAIIGMAAPDPTHPPQRLLRLYAYYENHTPTNPHPMNPRELLHLLFGNDSVEARTHPFLLRLHEFAAEQQAGVHPATRRMYLRPPLRTWARVAWEAEQEIAHHAPNWQANGRLGSRLFNTHTRQVGKQPRAFNRDDYFGFDKCNLFVADIGLRAGFCTCVHPVGQEHWHYMDANSFANHLHRTQGEGERVPVTGIHFDARRVWAWKIENALRAQPIEARNDYLNQAMNTEGRCFVLAIARSQAYVKPALDAIPARVENIAECDRVVRPYGIGHIVLVQRVLGQLQLAANAGDGLAQIEVQTWEASEPGALSRALTVKLSSDDATGEEGRVIRLHLFELQPGGDPDIVQGLRSLNVQNVNLNLLGTPDEAAPITIITT